MVPLYRAAALRGAGVSGPWTPADLASPLKVIADCRDAVWSGSALSSLANTGSLGGSFTLSGSLDKGAAVNSITPINGAGSDFGYLASVAMTGTTRFWYGVAKLASGRNTLWGHRWTASEGVVIYLRDNAISNEMRAFGDGTGGSGGNCVRTADPGTSLMSMSGLMSAGTEVVYKNAVALSKVLDACRTPVALTDDLYLMGSGPTYGPEGMVGDLFWACYHDADLSADDRQKLEGWASWTFAGDGSLLPTGHPYKSAAPTTGGVPGF